MPKRYKIVYHEGSNREQPYTLYKNNEVVFFASFLVDAKLKINGEEYDFIVRKEAEKSNSRGSKDAGNKSSLCAS